MSSTQIRIRTSDKEELRQLAKMRGTSMAAVLSEIIDYFKRKAILEEVNRAYAAMKSDEKQWDEQRKEQAVLDGSLADGLEPE